MAYFVCVAHKQEPCNQFLFAIIHAFKMTGDFIYSQQIKYNLKTPCNVKSYSFL